MSKLGSSTSSALSRTAVRPSALGGVGGAAAGGVGGKKKPVQKLDPEQVEELKEAFNLFDTDNNGQIDAKELKAALRALGFQVKKAEVRKMILDIDRDEAGTVSFDDFVELMTGRMSERDSKEEIAKVFSLFDHENTGKITFRDLKVRVGSKAVGGGGWRGRGALAQHPRLSAAAAVLRALFFFLLSFSTSHPPLYHHRLHLPPPLTHSLPLSSVSLWSWGRASPMMSCARWWMRPTGTRMGSWCLRTFTGS